MERSLRLIPTADAQRDAAAWLIPGDDPAAWLDALQRCGASMRHVRLHIVPRATNDPTPRGVLITVEGGATIAKPDPRCESYGLVAGVLYLPTHAKLLPAVSDDEVRAMVLAPSAVFHPVVGLVAFEAGDVLRPLDLLRAAPPRTAKWDAAQPGVTLSPRLQSVMPLEPPTLQQIERDLRDDIGTQPLKDMPRTPGDRNDSLLRRGAGRIAEGLSSMLRKLANRGHRANRGKDKPRDPQRDEAHSGAQGAQPAGAAGGAGGGLGGLLSGLAGWAAAQIDRLAAALQTMRQREIDRLLNMLERDPAEGLRHAIPLGLTGAPRGLAPPSASLGTRDVNFSLGNLGGGEAVDAWDISWEQQQRLMRRYRELAMQEARLGRHRRAAYIFANLLGDLHAAASVLAEGGYYREAATIYREKLNRLDAAAQCLEQGGLLLEAARLYIELERWLDAARLYRKLERDDEARRCVGLEVERRRGKSDFVGAAELEERELEDVDAAAATLKVGWHTSGQRLSCMEHLFGLFGRHGRHREAGESLKAMVDPAAPVTFASTQTTLLAKLRNEYPDRAVADAITESIYRVSAAHLSSAGVQDTERFTAALSSVARQDRLLSRDGRRFVQQRRSAVERIRPKRTPRQSDDEVVEVHAFQLPEAGVEWRSAASVGRIFYAAGWNADGLQIVRGDVEGRFDGVAWLDQTIPVFGGFGRSGLSIHPGRQEGDDVILLGPGARWPVRFLPATDPRVHARLLTPDWLPDDTLAVCTAVPGQIWAIDGGQTALNCYSRNGELLRSLSLAHLGDDDAARDDDGFDEADDWSGTFIIEDPPPVTHAPCLHARRSVVLLGHERNLFRFAPDSQLETHRFTQPIIDIIGAAPFARNRFALLHPQGATMVWDTVAHNNSVSVGQEMAEPVGAFTQNAGLLVLASRGECRVFGTSDGRLTPVQRIHWDSPQRRHPIAVLPLEPADDFAILFGSGEVVHFHVKPPRLGRR